LAIRVKKIKIQFSNDLVMVEPTAVNRLRIRSV
jgi:hypothetical protein